MKNRIFALAVLVSGCSASFSWGQWCGSDLWAVDPNDAIRIYLDRSLYDRGTLPGGIETVLDRLDDLAVVKINQVEGLVDHSSHLLDFGAPQGYHIRPFHILESAKFSPDGTRIAAVLSEPFSHAVMIYSIADGEGIRLADVEAVEGSVKWLDGYRIEYQLWLDDKPSGQQVLVDLSKVKTISSPACPIAKDTRLTPLVECCGGTCDDFNCGGSNPYPCCSNGGNCTWWCWDRACRNWGRALPGWGDAHSWTANAQNSGYTTGTVPQVGSIGCDSNNTLSKWGHVVWVLQVTSTQIYVSEQNCGGGYGDQTRWYNRSIFDGYIYNPAPAEPPQITQQPLSRGVCSGGSTVFTITASGQTPFSYRWQKNGSNLTEGGHYSGVTSASLTVVNVDAADVANYCCVVSNSVGSVTSNSASLTLNAATSLSRQPQDVFGAVSGSTVTFSVAATGADTMTYQWQKNSTNLANGGRLSGATSTTLQITGVTTGDAGTYRCVVTALCGSVTSKVAKLSFGPPGDFNGDGDVDLDDFGLFQACLSGPGSITNDPACDPAKIDADEDVDYVDLYLFINCMSGAGITADPDCTR